MYIGEGAAEPRSASESESESSLVEARPGRDPSDISDATADSRPRAPPRCASARRNVSDVSAAPACDMVAPAGGAQRKSTGDGQSRSSGTDWPSDLSDIRLPSASHAWPESLRSASDTELDVIGAEPAAGKAGSGTPGAPSTAMHCALSTWLSRTVAVTHSTQTYDPSHVWLPTWPQ